ncbi:MAG: DUF4263 domain-containing protein [Pseudomonadota bacterium]|nr:DUF4263 domain-containing protein [Pseudomonadota bacterium]
MQEYDDDGYINEDYSDYLDSDDYYESDDYNGAEVAETMPEYRAWKARRQREAEGEPSLEEFFVWWTRLRRGEVDAFREMLDAGAAEAEVQAFLEEHPALLVQTLRGGHGRWCIPQQRLGSEHVTDFLIAEKSSIGFEWTAVELESPTQRLTTKAGDLSAVLNHAIRQITDWRNWLSYNRNYATRPRDKSGLGLIDIDPQLSGLIIIGRRRDLDGSTADRRRTIGRDLRIEIHTYDWLAEVAEEAARAMDRIRR